jgi:hypothetical protein
VSFHHVSLSDKISLPHLSPIHYASEVLLGYLAQIITFFPSLHSQYSAEGFLQYMALLHVCDLNEVHVTRLEICKLLIIISKES